MFYFLRLGLSILWVKPITSETKPVTHSIFTACVKAAAAVSLWKYSSSNLCHYNFLLIFRALFTQHRNIVLLQHVYLCYKAPAIQLPTRLSCRSRRHSAFICHQHIVQPQPEGSQGCWWWESSSHWVNLSDSSASGVDDAVGTKQTTHNLNHRLSTSMWCGDSRWRSVSDRREPATVTGAAVHTDIMNTTTTTTTTPRLTASFQDNLGKPVPQT